MTKIDIKNLTIRQARKDLDSLKYSSLELCLAFVEEARIKNKEINAYLEIFDDIEEQAKIADKMIASKQAKMLTGIPCAIKDNILIQGRISSSSSKILEKYVAPYDATVIKKLREQGVIFVGRANMDEFAMGGSTENSAFGPSKNPFDTERVAGGSSGGSAAIVAMNGALFALGSDTGGSIRQPSAFCGLVGLKPTYGRVSRFGVMAMGSSLDQIGPICKNIDDTKLVYDIIRGNDPKDGTTIGDDTYSRQRIGKKKCIIGVPRDFLKGDGIDPQVMNAFENKLARLKDQGYEIKDIKLPNISYSLMVYYIVMPAEVSSNMARYDGMKYGMHIGGKNVIEDYFKTRGAGLGKEVKRRILLGTYVLSSGYYDAYYNRALAVRKMITDDFHKAFEEVDIIVTPTTPSPAFKIGEKTNDPVAMYLEDIFTVTANLTGMPAISIPSGFSKKDNKDLPVAIQLTARLGDEGSLFEVGKDIESK